MKAQNNTTSINPFDSLSAVTTTKAGIRKLPWTDQLQATARSRAIELTKACTSKDLAEKANKMLADGDAATLVSLINEVIGPETIGTDAAFLKDASADDIAKMLESQRSNRSKAKRGGLASMVNVLSYISAMYAELMLRSVSGKAFAATGNKLTNDHDELAKDAGLLERKINSLASKKSRLSKLAEYDQEAKDELAAIEAELQELRSLKPTKVKVVTKTKLADEVRKALSSLDKKDMTPELEALLAKVSNG